MRDLILLTIILGPLVWLFWGVTRPYEEEYEWEKHDFDWCVDCLMLDANGDVGDRGKPISNADPDDQDYYLYNLPGDDQFNNPSTRHAEKMNERWPDEDGWQLSNNCDEECEGHFSWSRCDGCGSTLGGDRHPAVAMRKVLVNP